MQSWSFGILCYNEIGSLPAVYDQVRKLIVDWGLSDWEILLVDDGSTDGTRDWIGRQSDADPAVKAILHPGNRGIGEGIRSIYFNATRENVVFIPGDGQFDVAELNPFPEFPASTFLSFYRIENLTYSTFRNALSWFNKIFNRAVLGLSLRDVNWVKVYKREILTGLDLRLHSSAIESEICAKLTVSGIRPLEIQSRYLPRRHGVSKGASLKSIFLVLRELFRLYKAVALYRWKKRSSQ